MAIINIELAKQQGLEFDFMDGYSVVDGLAANSQIIDETGKIIFQVSKLNLLDIINYGKGIFVVRKNIKSEGNNIDMIDSRLGKINKNNEFEVMDSWVTYASEKTKEIPFDFIDESTIVIEDLEGVYLYDLNEFICLTEKHTNLNKIEEIKKTRGSK